MSTGACRTSIEFPCIQVYTNIKNSFRKRQTIGARSANKNNVGTDNRQQGATTCTIQRKIKKKLDKY